MSTERPRLLDLFSGAGGAAMGYHRAGFDVYGIDIAEQRHYPFPFARDDALDAMARMMRGGEIQFESAGTSEWLTLSDFAAIHASPPCQHDSITANAHKRQHPDLVPPTRELLATIPKPWVIENVEGAPLENSLTLCGTEFHLRALDVDGVPLALKRHRLFESNIWLMGAGGCLHDYTQIAGVYTGSRHRKPQHRDNPLRLGGYVPAFSVRKQLMGIDWMTEKELAESIPPAYTEFIGDQLIEQLSVVL